MGIIVFSDEKKINIDDIEMAHKYYLRTLSKTQKLYLSLQMCKGSQAVWGVFAHDGLCDLEESSLVVWGMIAHDRLCELQKISERMISEKNQVLLHDHLILFVPLSDCE